MKPLFPLADMGFKNWRFVWNLCLNKTKNTHKTGGHHPLLMLLEQIVCACLFGFQGHSAEPLQTRMHSVPLYTYTITVSTLSVALRNVEGRWERCVVEARMLTLKTYAIKRYHKWRQTYCNVYSTANSTYASHIQQNEVQTKTVKNKYVRYTSV